MKKALFYIFIVLIYSGFHSCKQINNKQKEIKMLENFKNCKVSFPDSSINIIYKDSIYQSEHTELFSDKIKVVTNIDGGCGACIKKFNEWKNLVNRAKNNNNFSIIFFIKTNHFKYFKENYYPNIDFKNYPLFLDKRYSFLTKNKFPENVDYRTVLLNSKNKIILIGNPIYNDELMKLYKEEINKRLN